MCIRDRRAGALEKLLVIATMTVLLSGLPIDWFQTRAESVAREGNLRLVAAQLFLMLLGVLRIIGRLDDVIRVINLEISVFLLSGLALASFFWSADLGESIRQGIIFGAVTFYGLYLVARFEFLQIVRMLGVTFLLAAPYNLALAVLLPQFGTSDLGWTGVYDNKNTLGLASALALALLISAGRATPRWRLAFYAGVIGHSVLLFFSDSKTMWVAGFGAVGLMVVYRFFRSRRTLRGAVITSMVGSSLFAVFFATANIGLLAEWLDKDVTLTGRIPLWQDLILVGLERPFVGHGFKAAFGGYFSPIHEVWVTQTWEPQSAHNAILAIWLELGILGLAIFYWGFLRTIKRAVHTVNLLPGGISLWPLAYLSTALMGSVSESGITATNINWLLYVCVALSVARCYKSVNGLQPGGETLSDVPIEKSYEERFRSAEIDLVGSDVS